MPGWESWLPLHFGLAAALTWAARAYALRRRLLDHPGERRSHTAATPRGGGIAIVICLLLATGACWRWSVLGPDLLGAFAAGLLLVAGIGWWDDHRPLSPLSRFVVQVVAAAVLAWGVHQQADNAWLGLLAFALALVLVNVWNFMDGINGLAASQAAIAALGYALVGASATPLLAGALLAACLGFLPFNFPKARIFLGDVGSGALGYALAALAVLSVGPASAAWPVVMLPLAVFLVDAGFTLLSRMLAGDRWWTPHVTHVYQISARRHGHSAITVVYGGLSLLTLILMVLSSRSSTYTAIAATFLGYLGLAAGWWFARNATKTDKE
ncbi:lipopolysaccharide biosynthesis protein [Pseudoxanthomonas mexicana]|uniref:lipopolysaccharide biosynthesis protein n=1 Tax=Pseudoxanthomonas mexicana TaxID=128785 RepID=UPI00398B55F4